jgi:acetyl esterase/lipase
VQQSSPASSSVVGRFTPPAVLFALALCAVAGCRVTDIRIWEPTHPPPADACAVETVRGVAYYEGKDADEVRHRLDLFLPKGKQDFPVVVLVHGGAWLMGDNRCCGLYSSVGEFLAGRGIGAVLPNYRLSPDVKHPEHARDVARAVAWTKAHIAEHGGRTDQIFLAGHSAGGHLVTLLATDETYLKAEGLRTADIRGVIAVSGVYKIPAGDMDLRLGGATPSAFRLDQNLPLRDGFACLWGHSALLPGIPVSVNVFGPSFGDDPKVRDNASPLSHVRPGLPPFLLFNAEKDLPSLREMGTEFQEALANQGCDATLLRIPDRNHNSIMFRAVDNDDPVARAMLEFIEREVKKDLTD